LADSWVENGGTRRLGGDKPRHYIVGQAKPIDIRFFKVSFFDLTGRLFGRRQR